MEEEVRNKENHEREKMVNHLDHERTESKEDEGGNRLTGGSENVILEKNPIGERISLMEEEEHENSSKENYQSIRRGNALLLHREQHEYVTFLTEHYRECDIGILDLVRLSLHGSVRRGANNLFSTF